MTNVCPHCFNDEGLKKRIIEIRPDFPNEKCTFHPQYKGIPISAAAKIVDVAFRYQYRWGEFNVFDREQAGDPLDYLIEELTRAVDHDIAEALAKQLIEDDDYWPSDGGEAFYAHDQNYVHIDHHYVSHSNIWENFCRSIIHDQRFFNADAKQLVTEIFDGIHFQRDHQRRSPIYEIGPGSSEASFFRARIVKDEAQSEEITKDPENQLGAPPARHRRAGRMNPAGIGCFYAAYDLSTCIAELRPAVGSTVVGAKFELTRPVYVLDTSRFAAPMKPLSVFSKHYMTRLKQWIFMQQFLSEIAKPILRHDEHLDYIPTQAVAEYFLYHHNFKKRGKSEKIEAIIFQSAQMPRGKNIVLLGDAAQVQQDSRKAERRPGKSERGEFFPGSFESFFENLSRVKNPAIRVVEGSVEKHCVTGARYDTAPQFTHDFDAEDYDS